jgi:hypothetical protein
MRSQVQSRSLRSEPGRLFQAGLADHRVQSKGHCLLYGFFSALYSSRTIVAGLVRFGPAGANGCLPDLALRALPIS